MLSRLLVLLCALLLGCTQATQLGYLAIQGNQLYEEAQQLESIVLSAEMDEGDRAAFEGALRAIRFHANEMQRYDDLETIAQVDLRKLERNYLALSANLSFVISVLSQESVWSSFSIFEREQLKLFYTELIELSEEIERFREEERDVLQRAAKITAFSSVAVKVLLKVAEVYL